MREETFTQSTTSTFDYFHTSSPNILDTSVPLSLWYHCNATILIISTWRPFWHRKTNRRPQVKESIPQGIQFFRLPNFSFCLTKSILPLITWWKVSYPRPLILTRLYSVFAELKVNFVRWLLSRVKLTDEEHYASATKRKRRRFTKQWQLLEESIMFWSSTDVSM